jgi:tetratricopeptide (TPR) repeat protein
MKSIILSLVIAMLSIACANGPRPVVQNAADNSVSTPRERSQTAIAHSSENQPPPTGDAKSKWSQGGEAFDTSEYDKEVAAAEKALAAKSTDDKAKKTLSEAYYKRAVALTDKRQYASALGDYRRTIKYDPANTEAQEWIDKIIMIYGSLNKSYPPEGQEPPPLAYSKPK